MAINVNNGRWGLTRVVREADGGFTTSAMLAGIAPIVENHLPPMNAAKTDCVLPVALVRCIGTVNNTDPDTVLIPRDIDVSELTLGDLTNAQRTALKNALLTRLAAYDFTDWDGTLKQISAFTDASYTLATPLRQIARDIFIHLSHSDYRPKPLVVESHNTEYLDDFSTDPSSRWTAESSTATWDSGNSEYDVDLSTIEVGLRYSANDPGSNAQESQVTAVQHSTPNRLAMCGVRFDNTGVNDYYAVYEDGAGGAILGRWNAGTRTALTSFTTITATASQFRTYRLAVSGAVGSNAVLDAWYVAHTTTKPSDPGWYGTDASPLQTYTDTSASRLDDAVHAQCGIGGRGASGGTDWDTRHCYWKSRAISDRGGGGTVYTRTLSDTIATSDAPLRGIKAYRQVPQDSATLVDGLLRGKMHGVVTSDSLVLSDSAQRAVAAFRLMHDGVAASDDMLRFALLFRRMVDSFALTDALAVTLTLGGVTIVSRILQDSLNAGDTVLRAVRFYRREADAVDLIDSAWHSQLVVRQVIDLLSVSEAAARALLRTRVVTDTTEASDLAFRYALMQRLLHDDAEANDSLASQIAYYTQLIGFVLQSLRVVPVVVGLTRAEPILMEMHNI